MIAMIVLITMMVVGVAVTELIMLYAPRAEEGVESQVEIAGD